MEFFIVFNFVTASTIHFSLGLIIIYGKTGEFIREDAFQTSNPSLHYTRVMRIFPIVSIAGYYIAMFLMLKQRTVVKIANKIFKLIQIIGTDTSSQLFKSFENRCFMIWLIHLIPLSFGIETNNFSNARPDLVSKIFTIVLVWNFFVLNYLILVYIMILRLISMIMENIYSELKNGRGDPEITIFHMKCIGNTIDFINGNFRWEIAVGFVSLLMQIWLRVR